jgi:ferredoxin-NADP reductase
VARTTVLGRLNWRIATVVAIRPETAITNTLVLDVPEWPGHRAGQHVDVRLTAPDGYSVQRSYSIASTPDSSTVELTIQTVPNGEVSSFLVGAAMVGDRFELRGPVGGYFVWDPSSDEPVLLVAGGSGIVPMMAMIRERADAGSEVPFRLVYSVRDAGSVIYATELVRRVRDDHRLDVAYVYTRSAPPEYPYKLGRLDADRLAEDGWPAELSPQCYVCGPTGFVETVADLLVAAGHKAERIRTERFG